MKGTEYVVDHVSVEGVHKCVAIWSARLRGINQCVRPRRGVEDAITRWRGAPEI